MYFNEVEEVLGMPTDRSQAAAMLSNVLVGLLSAAALFVAGIVMWGIATAPYEQALSDASDSSSFRPADTPNAVTGGFSAAAGQLGQSGNTISILADAASQHIVATAKSAGSTSGSVVSGTAMAVGKGVSGLFVGAGQAVAFVAQLPVKAIDRAVGSPVLGSVIRPGGHEHDQVPIIDPDSPELAAAIEAAQQPVASAGNQPGTSADAVRWPLRGKVTTEFGERGWPYNPTHTGIDISDGTRPGTSAIRPFKPGTVVVVKSGTTGLGNYVTVDHGNGLTSVYAHLHTMAVTAGQHVGFDTVLGTEGTTGLSTGTHLHFEIRINGQAANPRQFIPGNPY